MRSKNSEEETWLRNVASSAGRPDAAVEERNGDGGVGKRAAGGAKLFRREARQHSGRVEEGIELAANGDVVLGGQPPADRRFGVAGGNALGVSHWAFLHVVD